MVGAAQVVIEPDFFTCSKQSNLSEVRSRACGARRRSRKSVIYVNNRWHVVGCKVVACRVLVEVLHGRFGGCM